MFLLLVPDAVQLVEVHGVWTGGTQGGPPSRFLWNRVASGDPGVAHGVHQFGGHCTGG